MAGYAQLPARIRRDEHVPAPHDWATAFGDATVAAAVLDRLLHRATVVGIDGPSYRLRADQQTSDTLRAAAGHRAGQGGTHAS